MATTSRLFVRIDDTAKTAARARATADGYTLSELVRRWLTEYAAGHAPTTPPPNPQILGHIRAAVDELGAAVQHIKSG